MIISRILAFISFSMVLMMIGAECLRSLQQNENGWITFIQVVEFVFAGNANSYENSVWYVTVNPIADIPAILIFVATTLLFAFIGRRGFRS